jgi:hypothetical protein
LIIPLIIQTILLDPSGAIWTDGPPDVSRLDPSGAVQIDAEHPTRKSEGRRFESEVGLRAAAPPFPHFVETLPALSALDRWQPSVVRGCAVLLG